MGCSSQVEQSVASVDTSAELNAGFLLIDGVYNSELMAPYDIFQHTIFHADGGIKVFTVAPEDVAVTTFEGLRILPDYTFDDHPLSISWSSQVPSTIWTVIWKISR